MATTKAKNEVRYDARSALYASVGAGQLLIDKIKELPAKTNPTAWRQSAVRTYGDLAERGEKLIEGIRRSSVSQRALGQTRIARSQVKAATTSVRKAARTTTEATPAAAKKVG